MSERLAYVRLFHASSTLTCQFGMSIDLQPRDFFLFSCGSCMMANVLLVCDVRKEQVLLVVCYKNFITFLFSRVFIKAAFFLYLYKSIFHFFLSKDDISSKFNDYELFHDGNVDDDVDAITTC